MSIAKFSVKNPVFINMLMIGLFLAGATALFRMPRELGPEINFNWVFITVPYPGAAPAETESLIVDPIEDEIQDVDNIDEILSTAGEGFGFVMVKFEDLSDDEFRERYTDLKTEVDKVEFPDEAEDHIVEDFSSGDFLPVITLNMSFSIPEDNAQQIADDIEEDLNDMAGVSKVQVSGLAEREIWVEVDPVKLNALRVTFDEIILALKVRNINVPGGNITFGKTEYLIRSLGEYQSIKEIENTIVRTTPGGEFVKIKDVARVNDRREEMPILSRINGDSSITFSVSKKGEANSIEVIDEIKALVKTYEATVPDGVHFSWTNDNSVYIMRIINVLRNNAVSGMILIFIVLFIFLGRWNAFLASLGIPISFFIAFCFMRLFDYSLNGHTLFALVMVVGIIVDDAIIVVENCHRHRMSGLSSHEAAIVGTDEVVRPVLASILTNIAAFLPLIFLPGIMGKFMRIVPIVFSLALIASLFEAFVILPSHYADWTVRSKVVKRGEKPFFKKMRRGYGRLLIKVLRMRYVLLATMVVLLAASIFYIAYRMDVDMYGKEDFDQFKVLVEMPEGTSIEETDRIMRKFEAVALTLNQDEVEAVIVNVGLLQGDEDWIAKKNVAQIIFQLTPREERDTTISEFIKDMRKKTEHISGPVSVKYSEVHGGPPVGKPVSVRVQGKYYNDIKEAANALKLELKKIKGVYDISDDFPPGKQEIRIVVDEEKAALYGFTTQQVSLNVRYAFDGVEATEYRDGDNEIDVIVKYNQKNRASVDHVLNLQLTNNKGKTVAIRDMVKFDVQPGPTELKRFKRKRTIMVTGEIDKSEAKLKDVNLQLAKQFDGLENRFPGVSFKIGGQFDEFMNVFKDATPLFVLGMVLIFLIMGTQFNSYIQPMIILITVPFALIGALLGLIVSQNPFSIVALFGVVALAGIVVNDAIVMIDFMNKRRAGDKTTVFQYWRSIVNSGRLRLRPIILTSLTTIFGLLPMALGIGGISEMWSPLANVIVFGLLVDTILTLFFVPSLVAIVDDIMRSRKKAKQLN